MMFRQKNDTKKTSIANVVDVFLITDCKPACRYEPCYAVFSKYFH